MSDEPLGNPIVATSENRPFGGRRADLVDADLELAAMKTLLEVLAPLDQAQRGRVLSWVEQRLAPSPDKPPETAEERRHRFAVENGRASWERRREKLGLKS